MTKRSLGIALLVGLPILGAGAYGVHSLTASKPPPPAAAAERAPAADEAQPKAKRHHGNHKKHHARAERADKGVGRSVDGAFSRWLVTPRGDAFGLMLADGTIVRLPRGAVGDPSLKAGEPLHIEGKVRRGEQGNVVARATVSKGGQTLFAAEQPSARQKGDRDEAQKLEPMTASGKVLALLPGRGAQMLGLVLDDGTTVLFGHHGGKNGGGANGDLGLHVGDAVTVEGHGGTYPIGRGIMAQSLKLPNGEVKTFARNKKGA